MSWFIFHYLILALEKHCVFVALIICVLFTYALVECCTSVPWSGEGMLQTMVCLQVKLTQSGKCGLRVNANDSFVCIMWQVNPQKMYWRRG